MGSFFNPYSIDLLCYYIFALPVALGRPLLCVSGLFISPGACINLTIPFLRVLV